MSADQFPHDADPRELVERERLEAPDQVLFEEPCRRCGARVFGALDDKSRGIYLDVGQPVAWRGPKDFARPGAKRHVCRKELMP